METIEKVDPKTFYSRCGGLIIGRAIPGRLEEIDGKKTMYGETMIEFTPVGQTKFGCFTTDDPRLIAALEKRMAEQGEATDILTPESFQAEVQAMKLIANPGDAKRMVEENNRLTRLLAEQGKLGPAAQVAVRK